MLNWIKENYPINKFTGITELSDTYCIIRHDVEFSVDRALQLAILENKLGISTTYLFQIRNNTYNSLTIINKNIYLVSIIISLNILNLFNNISIYI